MNFLRANFEVAPEIDERGKSVPNHFVLSAKTGKIELKTTDQARIFAQAFSDDPKFGSVLVPPFQYDAKTGKMHTLDRKELRIKIKPPAPSAAGDGKDQ